jgi:uncharacterized membrane protein
MIEYLKRIDWKFAIISITVSLYLWTHVRSIKVREKESVDSSYLKKHSERENPNESKNDECRTVKKIDHGNDR